MPRSTRRGQLSSAASPARLALCTASKTTQAVKAPRGRAFSFAVLVQAPCYKAAQFVCPAPAPAVQRTASSTCCLLADQ
eukprot:2720456-Pleurochrysis_carterae.AAC.2